MNTPIETDPSKNPGNTAGNGRSENRDPNNGRKEESGNQIVNEEEQIQAVNPGDRDWEKHEPARDQNVNKQENAGEREKHDEKQETESLDPIEGDDAGSMERKMPNM